MIPIGKSQPIFTAHLFPGLEAMLVELLASLSPHDWEKQTLAPKWKVKDVAAHLLDTELRRLSFCRDGSVPETGTTAAGLVSMVNRLNEEGVTIFRRLSARLLISLIARASVELCEYLQALDPFAEAPWSVSWAGEEKSANWFDVAREFTERWHHQEQIRVAVGKPGIMTRELYYPVLDCFMRALPFHYRRLKKELGVTACFNIRGDCGGSWYLACGADGWELVPSATGEIASNTSIPQEIAWRIFTKGISREEARAKVELSGDLELGSHILGMTAIVG